MGAIIAIVMLSSRSLAPAGQIAFLLTRARQARETLVSIERLFAVPDERKQGLSSLPATVRNATLKLEDCTFARSEEHTSELQSLMRISYAVFCLKKKKKLTTNPILQNTLSLT